MASDSSKCEDIRLRKYTDYLGKKMSKKQIQRELDELGVKMKELQYKLYANARESLLIVLQGIDGSGKDGTVRHVMSSLNLQSAYAQWLGVDISKSKSEHDLSDDYLLRIHKAIPHKGWIAIFNRSHYEDVIESKVHNLVPLQELENRYRQINDFERYLSENHIHIIKFFLNISKKEQLKRLNGRIEDPTKNWKISKNDLIDRINWDGFIECYEEVIERCNTKYAPWYIIPSNQKWFRNLSVARITVKTLEDMNLKFPDVDVSELRSALKNEKSPHSSLHKHNI